MCESNTALQDYIKNINTEQPNKLKIVHLNTQSLRDTAHQSEFIDTFSNCGIDIIVTSETWFKNTDLALLLPGYKTFNVNRSDKQGGGVAVFVKSTYVVKVLSTSNGESAKPDYIVLDILVGPNKILFSAMYRKPKGGFVSNFIDDFYKFSPGYKYSFLVGDLNAGFGRGGDDALVVPEMLNLCNLQAVPHQATYHTSTCNSILDVISSNCPEQLLTYGQTPAAGFSAHDCIFAIFDLSVPSHVKQKITFRNFKRICVESLLVDVEQAPWSQVYKESSIDNKVNEFNMILEGLMDRHAPEQNKIMKENYAPWMSKDSRSLWNAVRSLNIGKTTSPISDLTVNVNKLNEHYASVSTVRSEAIINETILNYERKGKPANIEKFYFKYVLPQDIIKAILSVKSNSIGTDGVSIKFVVLCLPALLPVLDHLFNFSLQHGIFPSKWKDANITPIPKLKNPVQCKDYRPLRRSFSFIPPNIRKSIVNALVMPHFDYPSVLFTDISDVNELKLQRLQNACVRFVTGVSTCEHISPSYIQLDLLKLRERRILAVALMTFRIINSRKPDYLYKKYTSTSSVNVCTTRSSKCKLQIPNHRTEKFHRSFLVQSSKIWNELQLYQHVGKSIHSVKCVVLNYLRTSKNL
ncbi:LINE-1 reverse transcriptase-like protein [Frankliniella fusca]|uniref:LINE-1 reverse transcriptase-like protein n=1 Tax=Frankliniella fusca TaxID=407009 RepID=A0AAE1HFG3_9NEOP|nr:LINE-1 reverse transcriptase-like protein [Frankliniella fusca]